MDCGQIMSKFEEDYDRLRGDLQHRTPYEFTKSPDRVKELILLLARLQSDVMIADIMQCLTEPNY